jgi:cell division protease FtsH
MLTVRGMSRPLPDLSLVDRGEGRFPGKVSHQRPSSEKVEQVIDEELQEILNQSYREDIELFQDERNELERTAKLLLSRETLDEADINRMLGPRPLHAATKVRSTAGAA